MECYEDINALAEEMDTWAGSLEDKFSSTQKYLDVSTTAETLQNIDEDFEDARVNGIDAAVIVKGVQDPTARRRGYSRGMQRDHIIAKMQEAEEALRSHLDEIDDKPILHDIVHALAETVDQHISELEQCKFPGAY